MFRGKEISKELLDEVLNSYSLNSNGIHGLDHWLSVERNALSIAGREDIQSPVFSLFALFHDARRENDLYDPHHGGRGAALTRELHSEGLFSLSASDLGRLCTACEHHTKQKHHDDPVIGICWDADRLDLPRIGVLPNAEYMNSIAAKQIANAG